MGELLWAITGNEEWKTWWRNSVLPLDYPWVCHCCNCPCMCHSGCRSNPPCCTATTQPASPSLPPPLELSPRWAYLHRLSANITITYDPVRLLMTKYHKTYGQNCKVGVARNSTITQFNPPPHFTNASPTRITSVFFRKITSNRPCVSSHVSLYWLWSQKFCNSACFHTANKLTHSRIRCLSSENKIKTVISSRLSSDIWTQCVFCRPGISFDTGIKLLEKTANGTTGKPSFLA